MENIMVAGKWWRCVSIVTTHSDLVLIAQRYIPSSFGTDLRVYIVDREPVVAMKRSSQGSKFKANISQGGDGELVPLTDAIYQLSKKVADSFEFDVGGIDLLFGESDDQFYLTELNIFAAYETVEESTKINITKLILEMMQRKILS